MWPIHVCIILLCICTHFWKVSINLSSMWMSKTFTFTDLLKFLFDSSKYPIYINDMVSDSCFYPSTHSLHTERYIEVVLFADRTFFVMLLLLLLLLGPETFVVELCVCCCGLWFAKVFNKIEKFQCKTKMFLPTKTNKMENKIFKKWLSFGAETFMPCARACPPACHFSILIPAPFDFNFIIVYFSYIFYSFFCCTLQAKIFIHVCGLKIKILILIAVFLTPSTNI